MIPLLLAFGTKMQPVAIDAIKRKFDGIGSPVPPMLACGYDSTAAPARLTGYDYRRVLLTHEDKPEADANALLSVAEQLLKSGSPKELWLLLDDQFPAALHEELREHWRKFAIDRLRPFRLDDQEPPVEVFSHKNPGAGLEWQDCEFLPDLLDEEERQQLRRALVRPRSVLITGGIGMGKTLLARYIHYHTKATAEGKFVFRNFAGIPETLVEQELYGIEAGIATGVEKRDGVMFEADGGTLFLDEIAETDQTVQAKLLHIISGRLEPIPCVKIGGKKAHDVRVRVVAATNRGGEELEKNLRRDLRSRFSTHIHIKSLREKKGNTLDFYMRAIEHFSELDFQHNPALCPQWHKEIIAEAVTAGELPDNLRELRDFVDRVWTERLYSNRPWEPVVSREEVTHARQGPSQKRAGSVPDEAGVLQTLQMLLSRVESRGINEVASAFREEDVQDCVFGCKRLALRFAQWFGQGNETRSMRVYGSKFRPSFKKLCKNPDSLHPRFRRSQLPPS
jgi:MoxR-like ATPase